MFMRKLNKISGLKRLACLTITAVSMLSFCSCGKSDSSSLFDEEGAAEASTELFADTATDSNASSDVTTIGGDNSTDDGSMLFENTNDNSTDSLDQLMTNNSDPSQQAMVSKDVYTVGDKCSFKFYDKADQQDVDSALTVTGVVRGDSAQQIVDTFNTQSQDVHIASLTNQDLEFAVVSYTLDLTNATTSIVNPISTAIDCKVIGTDGTGDIHYNGKIYSGGATQYILTDNETVITGNSGSGRIIYTVPKGCTDYRLQFGSSGHDFVVYTE